jgi:hypothetical protein
MPIIAINGKIGSGKDTIGKMIQYLTSTAVDKYAFDEFLDYDKLGIRVATDYEYWSDWQIKKFAGKLKQIASILSGIPAYKFEDQEFKNTFLSNEWNYFLKDKTITDDGIGLVVNKMTVREFLQKLGTEAMRNGLHTNTWVNALFSDYTVNTIAVGSNEFDVIDEDVEPKWIITDLRFPNEYDAVAERNGITIRVTRPDTVCGTHPSETALDTYSFDYEISNDGDYTALLNKVRAILVKENLIP